MRCAITLCLAIVTAVAAHAQPLGVLLVGDSIVVSDAPDWIGYYHHLKASQPEWEITKFAVTNSQNALERYNEFPEVFAGQHIIYFNTGLHSLRWDRFEDQVTYAQNLGELADLLVATEATIIWRSTTPIAEGASGGRDHALVPVYNDIARDVMAGRDVMVDDLYHELLPYYNADPSKGGQYLAEDGTHWNSWSQREIIAPSVAAQISLAAADRNHDGVVDGDDLLHWQQHGGSSGMLAEWQHHVGQSTTPTSVAIVPEPLTILLAAACLAYPRRFRG